MDENPAGKLIRCGRASDELHEASLWALIEEWWRPAAAVGRRHPYRTAPSAAFEEVLHPAAAYSIIGGPALLERKEVRISSRISGDRERGGQPQLPARREHGNARHRSASVDRLEAYADSSDKPVGRGCSRGDARLITPRSQRAIAQFTGVIQTLRRMSENTPVSDLVKETLERSGYMEALKSERTMEARGRSENLEELVSVATMFDTQAEDTSLEAFLSQVPRVGPLTHWRRRSAVTLMTLHAAKGLEFRLLFGGLEERRVPHSRSLYGAGALEEERRLCYVGMTRAKEECLTYAFRRMTTACRTLRMSRVYQGHPGPRLRDSPGARRGRALGRRRAAARASRTLDLVRRAQGGARSSAGASSRRRASGRAQVTEVCGPSGPQRSCARYAKLQRQDAEPVSRRRCGSVRRLRNPAPAG